MIKRNPQLPSWHPRHEIHLRHLDFCAQLLARRLSLMDVDDFLVATAEFTPRWAEMMLEEILRPRRRAQIERSLAKRDKKYVNEWERKLLTWNADADTILDADALIREAVAANDRGVNTDALITPVSPYLEVQWGLSTKDEYAASTGFTLPLSIDHDLFFYEHRDRETSWVNILALLQVKFAEPLDRFFSDTLYAGEIAERGYGRNAWRTTSTRNYRDGRLASLLGNANQQVEYENSRPYIELINTSTYTETKQTLINAYTAAQEELARATLVATLFYLIILHSGDISEEARKEGIHRARATGRESKMGDMPISDIVAYYMAVFGVS